MTIFLNILTFLIFLCVLGSLVWAIWEHSYRSIITLFFCLSMLSIFTNFLGMSKKIDECEKELPRTEHCEIVVKAVEVDNE